MAYVSIRERRDRLRARVEAERYRERLRSLPPQARKVVRMLESEVFGTKSRIEALEYRKRLLDDLIARYER